ncbi:hypothetical protein FDT66_08360 [Polaribacter aestuariivivens]|uniref:DNA topoisomerase IV n=1 Tax=Polaribacter aestuariivivens TaxID=2304626 RepID=A0A5S3N3I9_9FLAO|nr:hypothetical protein [Polaribacter aestuariivivens]TMM29875.1 hypothetical protein FDT66_08360 [Polaribacter aestuariivivens]
MKKLYFLIAFLSVGALMSFTDKDKDCAILKNNTFTYRNGSEDVIVIFKENDHVEYHNDKEHFIKSDIEWVNDCEYYLVIKESTLPNFPFKMGTKMHIKVTKVRGKKVYYTSTLGGRSWDGRLTKRKNTEF